jgi:type I restriction enzyme S subunit
MSEWKEYRLGDVCERVTSGGTPNTRINEYYGGQIPWVRTQEIEFNRLYDTQIKITNEGLVNSSAKWIPENSVIVAMYGATAGKVAINKIPVTTNQACCNLIIDNNKADYRFIYYNILSRFSSIANLAVGGAQQNLNAGMIKDLLISLPDLPTQTAIAEILSSLDDKIELNNKINQELEALAQTLFKRWFVDFEFPNENGEPYKSSGGEMVDSELGEIPKGWEQRYFKDCLEVSRGLSYNGAGLTDSNSGIPMINLNSVIEGGGYKEEGIKYYNGKYKKNHLISSWDIAVANTEQGHKYLLIGYPAFVPKYVGSIAIFSHHIYKVKSKISSYLTNQFIYHLIKQNRIREQIIGSCNGTTVNMLKSIGFESPIFIQPPKHLVTLFTDLVTNFWERYELNTIENKILTNLRDTLLPKLISGELEVS